MPQSSLSFPDDLEALIAQYTTNANTDDNLTEDRDAAISNAFFEFANAKRIQYRNVLTFDQDTKACNVHTGGIIWETSYILLEHLKQEQQRLGRCVELGAGDYDLALSTFIEHTKLIRFLPRIEAIRGDTPGEDS